jgi:hypothetical protein
LTDAELYRLDDFYSLVMSAYMVRKLMEELGLNPVRRVSDQSRTIADEFFYYPVSRTWYALYASWVEGEAPILGRAIREAMNESPGEDSPLWVNAWRSEFARDE